MWVIGLTSRRSDRWLHRLVGLHYQRNSSRTTSLRPDHTSVTAHTLMSTKPSGSATSRIVFSVMSVGTWADFLGHDTQIGASEFSFFRSAARSFCRSFFRVTKTCAMA